MARTSPVQFFREVRQEVAKVTWPTRRETVVSTGLVLAMVVVISVFFLAVDQFFAWAVREIFGLSGS